MSLIINQEDLDKAKMDLTQEIKVLKTKYSFLHSHEIKSIILEVFSSGKNHRKEWRGEKKANKSKVDSSLA